MVFTDPIQSAKQLETFAKTAAAIVFHAVWDEEQGYRRIKRELEPLEIYCMKGNRPYNILELHSHGLLKDYSDFKKKPQVTRGVAFYKKGELLLEMKGFGEEDFDKACKKFDTMQPGKKEEGCCSGCTVL
ncbi:hypothetical protein H4R99_001543 [Coemansia sp. RSA 1722]|nr:hypothetical protein IWW45_000488 [Coemansia sp. RSA 485]KAJ2604859.1 hypothetical protein H4R99_001543 [Coemansia sp. RSA 1722]KAJ2638178.1 hypothetical protein GGF40_001844 [Coemansia sp. RSA 1286]